MYLILTFTNAQTAKMQYGDNNKSGVTDSFSIPSCLTKAAINLPPLLQLNYPLVRFYKRLMWKNIAVTRKDTVGKKTVPMF